MTFPMMPGVPAAGHVTAAGGYWHPGRAENCPTCNPPPQRSRDRIPHMMGSETLRGTNQFGFPFIDTIAPCGQQVAVTLTTRRADLVRCVKCRAAAKEKT